MGKRVILDGLLEECENTSIDITIREEKKDKEPICLEITDSCSNSITVWLREADVRKMVKLLNAALRERKALVG